MRESTRLLVTVHKGRKLLCLGGGALPSCTIVGPASGAHRFPAQPARTCRVRVSLRNWSMCAVTSSDAPLCVSGLRVAKVEVREYQLRPHRPVCCTIDRQDTRWAACEWVLR